MREFTLRDTGRDLAPRESAEVFMVKRGASAGRVHNPEFNHRIVQYRDGSLILSAQPTVISAHRGESRDVYADDIYLGEMIKVDGEEYIVTSRVAGDPILTRPGV